MTEVPAESKPIGVMDGHVSAFAGGHGQYLVTFKSFDLQFVFLHQVPKRAIRDAEQIGGFGLHAVGAIQSALQ